MLFYHYMTFFASGFQKSFLRFLYEFDETKYQYKIVSSLWNLLFHTNKEIIFEFEHSNIKELDEELESFDELKQKRPRRIERDYPQKLQFYIQTKKSQLN